MMRSQKVVLLAVIALALAFSGCHHNKTGNVSIQIKARFNGQNVALVNYQDTVTFTSNGRLYQFSAIEFYLSHITLVGTDGSLTEVSAAEFINFSNPASLTLNYKNLKGSYRAVQFGCGLDSIQNNSNPKSLDTTNPTSPLAANNNNDMYWSMQKYRFETFDGEWDSINDPYNFLREAFSYHVGGPGLYRTPVIVPNSFSISADNTTSLVLYLDIQKIFNGSTETLSFPSEELTQTSSSDNPVIAQKFSDNFSQAFTF